MIERDIQGEERHKALSRTNLLTFKEYMTIPKEDRTGLGCVMGYDFFSVAATNLGLGSKAPGVGRRPAKKKVWKAVGEAIAIPYGELPRLVSHPDPDIRKVVAWRLELGK